MSNDLFSTARIGRYTLRNRFVMAPMTRSRADDNSGVPSDLVAIYYGQRADAGLIITEGTYPSPMGKGYVRTPGIHSAAQIDAWRAVTAAVHARGGRIFLQLMHTGRISHPDMLPDGATPVAPSSIRPAGQGWTASGQQDFVTPRTLSTEEVAGVVDEYRRATRHALEAGFDGVELHAASGYLPEQFLSSGTNQRADEYGGSLENRARFILEVLAAMTAEAGGDRVGIKISPEMGFNDIVDAEPHETYRYLVKQLAPLKLAYLHVAWSKSGFDYHGALQPLFGGAYLRGGALTKETAQAAIAEGKADAVVFGGLYLANPDLPQRFLADAPLNAPDRNTLYSPGPDGYIDYPVLDAGNTTNRALRIHAYGGADAVQIERIAEPVAGAGEVVVRVRAAGVNGFDWKVRDGLLHSVFPLTFPVTLGSELAGEVIALGAGVTDFAIGDRVMGPMSGPGAYADRVAVAAANLTPTPPNLDDVHAAAIPVTALTAWQALFDAGGLTAGQTVLIHGAAGGVGGFAVQFARRAGARVVVTARGTHADYLRSLGAHDVIDYRTTAFHEHVADVDLVLDLVGGTTLADSWQVLRAGGRIVSTAAPEILTQIPIGKNGVWFQMRPDQAQLADIVAMVARGDVKVDIAKVAEVADAANAIEQNKIGYGRGKGVIRFA
ncbi:N-ethylmaleimide reductase NemA [Paraburkholderia acidicola]|uniref:N-ethylmaleimide reductase NemA n=1 Tax=Paraburkholderia acidicola TaxID=1912599 RepID=A0A2A4EZQ0_9BURK|nr:zinc-binding dehydrogenase [Paraburkholderia acidicola]PCE25922.1 N-ethylmaleimide reductase NemA [Paraburkholderia acidicola]